MAWVADAEGCAKFTIRIAAVWTHVHDYIGSMMISAVAVCIALATYKETRPEAGKPAPHLRGHSIPYRVHSHVSLLRHSIPASDVHCLDRDRYKRPGTHNRHREETLCEDHAACSLRRIDIRMIPSAALGLRFPEGPSAVYDMQL